MEEFYIGAFFVFLLAGIAANSGSRNKNVAAEWVVFLFGFFTAMAFGVPIMHWLAADVFDWVQHQPPGTLGSGS